MQDPLACCRNRPNTLVDLKHTLLFQIARQGHTHTHMVASPSFTHNTFHLSKSQEDNHVHIVASRSCISHTFISTYISFLQVSHTTHNTFPNHKKTITHTCTPISSYVPLFQIPHTMHLCLFLVQITRQQLILQHTHTHTHIQLGGGF